MPLFDDGASLAIGKALDSVALRERVHANNIANVMTPGFRASRVDFEDSLAAAVAEGDPTRASASLRATGGSVREDGNDVEIEAETGGLMKAGLQYQALTQAMSFKFALLTTAVKG